jgi:hypothetical protein
MKPQCDIAHKKYGGSECAQPSEETGDHDLSSPRKVERFAIGLRRPQALSYKRMMTETTYFPRRLILAGAVICGVLLALAVHMLGARFGLDLGGLWRSDTREFMPVGAALAWWLIATVGFCGGYFTATLMDSALSGQIPQRMRQFLIAVGVLVLAGAGQAASGPSPIPTVSGVLAGIAALCLGAAMAFCGAHFALRKA